jgi:hypothetical protein
VLLSPIRSIDHIRQLARYPARMFRVTAKKSKKKTVTRLRSDSDEENDNQSQPPGVPRDDAEEAALSDVKRVKDKSKKRSRKKMGLVVRSFEPEEEEDSIFTSTKKSKKRQRGIGFGGATAANVLVHDEDDDVVMKNPDDDDHGIGDTSGISYGKESLENLRQQQQYKTPVVEEQASELQHQAVGMEKAEETVERKRDPDYIPLNGRDPLILTGDDALDFDVRRHTGNYEAKMIYEEHFQSVTEDSTFLDSAESQQQAREASAWEAEVTRRAGLSNGSKTQTRRDDKIENSNHIPTNTIAVSLANLRSQFQSTIAQLDTQRKDTDRACERRRVELSQTKEELRRQEEELKQSGTALEDYQQLREDFTLWAGALRELKDKVQPILDAFIDLDADIASPTMQRDWEDDVCAILYQAGLVDRVLGRQPPDFVFEDTTTYVDEFGRDVKSQHAMNREKRIRRLVEIQRDVGLSTNNESSTGPFWDEYEIKSFQERRTALGKALGVALKDLEEEYTLLSQLAAIFRKWRKAYPEDFKQCFANLSLGDLASVLVQMELCKLNSTDSNSHGWLEGWSSAEERNDDCFGWIGDLALDYHSEGESSRDSSSIPAELVDRIIAKAYIPVLNNLLNKSAYRVASTKQSRALSNMYGQLAKLVASRSHPQLETLSQKVFNYIKTSLDNVAIVILNQVEPSKVRKDENGCDVKVKQEELLLALDGATKGQVRLISKMLLNIITYWAPHLAGQASGNDVVEFLLDFMSSKYLFLLSSVRGRSDISSGEFSSVWIVLQKTQWLDQPGRMLQAAPLRAAAMAFKLT